MAFPQTGGATKCSDLSSNVCRHETLWVAVNYPMKLICRILLEILKASAVIFTKTSWNFIVIAGLFMTPRMFKVGDWPFNVNFFIHLQIDNKSYFTSSLLRFPMIPFMTIKITFSASFFLIERLHSLSQAFPIARKIISEHLTTGRKSHDANERENESDRKWGHQIPSGQAHYCLW